MEVVLIYANWCGHCRDLLNNIDQYKILFKNKGLKFTMIESNNTDLLSQYESKYKFNTQYFPFLFIITEIIENNKKSYKIEELPTDIGKLNEKLSEFSKKETFINQNNNIIVVFTSFKNEREKSIIEKYRKLSLKNNYDFRVIEINFIQDSFFIILNDSEKIKRYLSKISLNNNSSYKYLDVLTSNKQKYYFIKEDLLKLYNIIVNTNKNIGSSFIPQFLLNLLNPDYNQQSKLNNNRVIKCKLSNNDYPSNMDCQTIY